MKARATGIASVATDSGDLLGYGFIGYESNLPNPLVGATVTTEWVFNTEDSGPNISAVPYYAQFEPGTFWIKSNTTIDPTVAGEPNIEFGPLGPRSNPIDASDFLHQLIISSVGNENLDNPDIPPTDGYQVYSNQSNPIPGSGTEVFDTGAYIRDISNDIIVTLDLAQELVWSANDAGYGSGYVYWEDPSIGVAAIYYTLSSFSVKQVPEPTTLGMLSAGLLGLGVMRRKRAA